MGMWLAYYEAYQDKAAEEKAHLEIKKTNARILMIAGGERGIFVTGGRNSGFTRVSEALS